MNVHVLFFASLKEHLGRAEMYMEVAPLPTVAVLWDKISSGNEALPEKVLFAVNHKYVHADYQLEHGDVVAFFPPVTGG